MSRLLARFNGRLVRDRVDVAAPLADAVDVARGDEVGHDALGGALGDVDRRGDVAHPHPRVFGDAQQRERMVGEKRERHHIGQRSS